MAAATSREAKSSRRKPESATRKSTTTQDDHFKTNKKDKRSIKHSTFVSRIEKSKSTAKRRRRPVKKLVTNLDALADALPDATDTRIEATNGQVNIIRHKSLKSRPGAMKRKEKLDKLERERFAKNMAQMAQTNPSTTAGVVDTAADNSGSTSQRWASLRNFISQTMETKPEVDTTKK